jgi:signal transduction histidine kinase
MTGRFHLTVRSRIAVVLTAVVVAAGVVLLMASYELVRANLNSAAPASPVRGSSSVYAPSGRALPAAAHSASAVRAQIAHHTLSALIWQYSAIVAGLIVVSAVVAWLVAGRILRPIRTITAAARRITSEDLHERVSLPGPHDELGELGDTFDSMLARLETAFQGEQLFAANAAHQLRTPLAVLGAELELLATHPAPDAADVRDSARRMRRTIVNAQQLLEKLLTLTRGSVAPEDRAPVRLDKLAGERLSQIASRADDRALSVTADLAPVTVPGDRALLAELVDNLLDNAIRYNTQGGHIGVRTVALPASAILEITNSGLPIADAEAPGLLEPFRRASQQRVGSGYGLGLSVVRAITKAHDGHVDLDAPGDGGLHVRVTLPPHWAEHRRPRDPAGVSRAAQPQWRSARPGR